VPIGAPVRRWTRNTLPPSESRSRGLVPTAASPVPTRRASVSRSSSSRQPPCRPELEGSPETTVRRWDSVRHLASTRQRVTWTWLPPFVAPWQAHSVRDPASTASDINPVSPETQTDADRSASVRRLPARTTLTRARSRSDTSSLPPGPCWTSHGCSSLRATVRTRSVGAQRPTGSDDAVVTRSGGASSATDGASPASRPPVRAARDRDSEVVRSTRRTSVTLTGQCGDGKGLSRAAAVGRAGCRRGWWRSPAWC